MLTFVLPRKVEEKMLPAIPSNVLMIVILDEPFLDASDCSENDPLWKR
jgi:hypothetical protein